MLFLLLFFILLAINFFLFIFYVFNLDIGTFLVPLVSIVFLRSLIFLFDFIINYLIKKLRRVSVKIVKSSLITSERRLKILHLFLVLSGFKYIKDFYINKDPFNVMIKKVRIFFFIFFTFLFLLFSVASFCLEIELVVLKYNNIKTFVFQIIICLEFIFFLFVFLKVAFLYSKFFVNLILNGLIGNIVYKVSMEFPYSVLKQIYLLLYIFLLLEFLLKIFSIFIIFETVIFYM